MANRIVLNTVSYHGKGAIEEIPGVLASHGCTKVFVCSDFYMLCVKHRQRKIAAKPGEHF